MELGFLGMRPWRAGGEPGDGPRLAGAARDGPRWGCGVRGGRDRAAARGDGGRCRGVDGVRSGDGDAPLEGADTEGLQLRSESGVGGTAGQGCCAGGREGGLGCGEGRWTGCGKEAETDSERLGGRGAVGGVAAPALQAESLHIVALMII